jgi:hypothetical protein
MYHKEIETSKEALQAHIVRQKQIASQRMRDIEDIKKSRKAMTRAIQGAL